jgi:hypothetical protein
MVVAPFLELDDSLVVKYLLVTTCFGVTNAPAYCRYASVVTNEMLYNAGQERMFPALICHFEMAQTHKQVPVH